MTRRNRQPVQSSTEWHNWLKQIQREIMLTQGENKSIPDIQDEILKDPYLKSIEKNIIKKQKVKDDIKIKMDIRRW
jgi:hypothetical protein